MRKQIAKLIALILAMAMVMGLCACGGTKSDNSQTEDTSAVETTESGKETLVIKTGMLTMLNKTEEEMGEALSCRNTALSQLRKEGYNEKIFFNGNLAEKYVISNEVIFYDTLDAMLMALNAGEIEEIIIDDAVARYLCANNDNLVQVNDYEGLEESGNFAALVKKYLVSDYSFMFKEGNEELRDQFNEAINRLDADGTLDILAKNYIEKAITEGTVEPIELPNFKDADTIKVAITGSLPPMDYVAADGTAAGYSTALMAEISKRIGKNIELVVVDSVGRATALASGTVDVVFWTRSSDDSMKLKEMDETERNKVFEDTLASLTDEERKVFEQMEDYYGFISLADADMPEGTIITKPYYADISVSVTTKELNDKVKNMAEQK